MPSYLLLRDNKQKGPYSLDDLTSLGLKPYDLVWIEGKSAAWRYPSEIAELKAFAPIVEEQPFDRFFKKNDTTENNSSQIQKIEERNEQVIIVPVEQVTTGKKVYVSLPGSGSIKTRMEQKSTKQGEAIKPAKQVEQVKYEPQVIPDEFEEEEKVVRLEKRFSQPLDEIKDMYVQTLVDRKKKIAKKRNLASTLKKASVPFYILVLGIVIGFAVKNFGFKKNSAASDALNQSAQKNQQNNMDETETTEFLQQDKVSVQTDKEIENIPAEKTAKENFSLNREPIKEHTISEKPSTEVNKNKPGYEPNKKKNEEPELAIDEPVEGVKSEPVNGERQKSVRTETNKTVENPENNIAGIKDKNNTANSVDESIRKVVSVKSNNYKRGTFGGIFDLQLTVNNDSKYVLDEVIVELQYLKPSEELLKSETIHFRTISPRGSSTVSLPPSTRGIKVAYFITKIRYKDSPETAGL